jgi:hypothetical protein
MEYWILGSGEREAGAGSRKLEAGSGERGAGSGEKLLVSDGRVLNIQHNLSNELP